MTTGLLACRIGSTRAMTTCLHVATGPVSRIEIMISAPPLRPTRFQQKLHRYGERLLSNV